MSWACGFTLVSSSLPALSLATHLRLLCNGTEPRKRVVQLLLANPLAQVADEEVGADVNLLLVVRGLVHADRLAEQFDLVHDLARVVGVVFR